MGIGEGKRVFPHASIDCAVFSLVLLIYIEFSMPAMDYLYQTSGANFPFYSEFAWNAAHFIKNFGYSILLIPLGALMYAEFKMRYEFTVRQLVTLKLIWMMVLVFLIVSLNILFYVFGFNDVPIKMP